MNAVIRLAEYAREKDWIEESETPWAVNQVLEALGADALPSVEVEPDAPLHRVLDALCDDAYRRGALKENTVVYRDLLDTAMMGRLTPRPAQVIDRFRALYGESPQAATDWYYAFSQDTNYIRRDRIAKDEKWRTETEYGALDMTINLSKPEKDPKAIAAARELPQGNYPRCSLCRENEGYAGRLDFPARQNHRLIPLSIGGEEWFLQYSPYVYYSEHCICLSGKHIPMKIDRACFDHLLEFVGQFPHYFVGSNADLPIVGGSILAHDHFQGGRYSFPMERAAVETPFTFPDFPDVQSGIVKWPMAVIRLAGGDPARLAQLGERILNAWRGYSDPEAQILAYTQDEPHNTITPIARMRAGKYELDLVLRNNRTTSEHPLGLFHPHAELHHIKKENIGLIEVMGLAVLPARLKKELHAVAEGLAKGADLRSDPQTEKHAAWAEDLRSKYAFTLENAYGIVQKETGLVFARVLEQAGVFARSEAGQTAFLRFLKSV